MLYSTEGDIVHIEIESEYNTHKDKGMHDRMYDYQSYIVQNTFAEVEQNRKEHVKSKLGKFKSVVFYLFGSPQGKNEFYKRHPVEIDAGDYSVRSYYEAFYLRNMDVEKAIDNGNIFLLPFVYRRKGVIEIFEKKEGKLRELFDNTTVQQRLAIANILYTRYIVVIEEKFIYDVNDFFNIIMEQYSEKPFLEQVIENERADAAKETAKFKDFQYAWAMVIEDIPLEKIAKITSVHIDLIADMKAILDQDKNADFKDFYNNLN